MAKNRAGAERAVAFRLNHYCELPECRGVPGEVVEVSPEVAERLLARGGGDVVTGNGKDGPAGPAGPVDEEAGPAPV